MTNAVLVVEDEANIATALKLNLELEGYCCDTVATGREALHHTHSKHYACIILDVMLPDDEGFQVCRDMRKRGNLSPVLMLTARNHPKDRVTGLDAGADDYLAKPFELAELLARVRSLIRRAGWGSQSEDHPPHQQNISLGAFRINFANFEVSGPRQFTLTALEARLLLYFLKHPNRIISREELLSKVWDVPASTHTRTVDNFVMRLRRYFEHRPSAPTIFTSVRGEGYRFIHPPVLSSESTTLSL